MFTIKDEEGHSQVWLPTPGNMARAQWRMQKILHCLPANANVLEVGCGYGDLTKALLEAGHLVTAVDQSTKMIAATKKRCQNFPNLILHNENIFSYLNKNNEKYDAIVGIGILHHLTTNLSDFLQMISQHTKPDGRALFWEPNRQNPIVKFIFGTTWGRHLFKLEEAEDAFSKSSFKDLAAPNFKVVITEPQDWAYPHIPEKILPLLRLAERYAPKLLNNYIAQSLWIELYNSDFLEATNDKPK